MNDHVGVGNEELHAFIDGEVDPNRGAEIVELAAADAILASRIAAFRGDKERLGEAYGKVRDLPLPSEWLRLIEDQTARQRPFASLGRSRRLVGAIAAAVLLLLGIGIAYQFFSVAGTDGILAEALAARQNAMRPEQSLAAGNVAAPDARDQVLTRALAMMVKVPDLTRLGYQLADIHVYSGVPGGRAVELTYVDPQKRLFTLYLRHPSGPPRVDLLQRDRMRICIWQDDVVGTVMLGEMSAGEMARIASLAYSGLTL